MEDAHSITLGVITVLWLGDKVFLGTFAPFPLSLFFSKIKEYISMEAWTVHIVDPGDEELDTIYKNNTKAFCSCYNLCCLLWWILSCEVVVRCVSCCGWRCVNRNVL